MTAPKVPNAVPLAASPRHVAEHAYDRMRAHAADRGHERRTVGAGLGGLVGGMAGSFRGGWGPLVGAAIGALLGAAVGDALDARADAGPRGQLDPARTGELPRERASDLTVRDQMVSAPVRRR